MKLNYFPTILPLTAITCLTLLMPSTVKAEESEIKHPAKPFLWKVEGKDLTKSSYLLALFISVILALPHFTLLHRKHLIRLNISMLKQICL